MRKIKNTNNNKKKIVENNDMNVKSLLKAFIIILITFVIFYGLTILIVNKTEKNKKTDKVGITESTNDILISELLDQKEETYYVLAINDSNQDVYTFYKDKLKDATLYNINLENALNKNIKSTELVIDDDPRNIKINDSVLFVVSNGKLLEYHVGLSDITAYFRTMAK